MELRLANDEEKKVVGTGMNYSREDSFGNSETYAKPRNYEEEKNPWDFDDLDEEPYVTTSIRGTINSTDLEARYVDYDIPHSLKITKIIVYVAIGLVIAASLWICTQSKVDLLVNASKIKILSTIAFWVGFADVFVINKYGEKNGKLYLWWFFLFAFYPIARNKHVEEKAGEAPFVAIAYLLTMGVLFSTAFKAGWNYGDILDIKDNKARTEAAAVVDQKLSDGRRLQEHMAGVFLLKMQSVRWMV